MLAESALIVPIPEAEFLVSRFRERFDTSAAVGVPAHVTLLYPFKPPAEIAIAVVQKLAEFFSRVECFHTSFTHANRFPGVLYLAPEPDEMFRRLTKWIAIQFPETPPYGGKFAEVIPHLTIADVGNTQLLNAITDEFERAAKGRLPIHATIKEVCLIDNQSGQWTTRKKFRLSGVTTTWI
jgi:2'-5' RNA ligase